GGRPAFRNWRLTSGAQPVRGVAALRQHDGSTEHAHMAASSLYNAASLARRSIPGGAASVRRFQSVMGCRRPPTHAGHGWGTGALAEKYPRWHARQRSHETRRGQSRTGLFGFGVCCGIMCMLHCMMAAAGHGAYSYGPRVPVLGLFFFGREVDVAQQTGPEPVPGGELGWRGG